MKPAGISHTNRQLCMISESKRMWGVYWLSQRVLSCTPQHETLHLCFFFFFFFAFFAYCSLPLSTALSLCASLSLSRSSYFTTSLALSHSLLLSLPHFAPTLSVSLLSMLCPLAPSLCTSPCWVSLKSISWRTTGHSSPSTRCDVSLTYAPILLLLYTH